MGFFATTLFGRMTGCRAFVRSLVARHVTSATRPSWSPTRTRVPDVKRLFALDGEAREGVPSVSWSAKPSTTALTR